MTSAGAAAPFADLRRQARLSWVPLTAMRVLIYCLIAALVAIGAASFHWRWGRSRAPGAGLSGRLSSFLVITVACWSVVLAILFVFAPSAGTAGPIQDTHGDAIAPAAFSVRGWTIAAMLLASLLFVERSVVSIYLFWKGRWTEMAAPGVACACWVVAAIYLTTQPGLWFWPRV